MFHDGKGHMTAVAWTLPTSQASKRRGPQYTPLGAAASPTREAWVLPLQQHRHVIT